MFLRRWKLLAITHSVECGAEQGHWLGKGMIFQMLLTMMDWKKYILPFVLYYDPVKPHTRTYTNTHMTETKIYKAILSLKVCDSDLHFLFHSISFCIKYDGDRLHWVWPCEKHVRGNILRVMVDLSYLLSSLEMKFCLFGRIGFRMGSCDSKWFWCTTSLCACDFKNIQKSKPFTHHFSDTWNLSSLSSSASVEVYQVFVVCQAPFLWRYFGWPFPFLLFDDFPCLKKKKSPLSKKGRCCRIIFSDLEKIYIGSYLFKMFLTDRNRHLICGFNVQDLV